MAFLKLKKLKFKKIPKLAWLVLGLFLVLLFFLFLFPVPQAEKIKWGVNFSAKQATLLGVDWKENYLALLDDLGVKRIKLITYWDELESEKGKYNFADLDWQINEAEKREANILLVVGVKTPRWPECHIPLWAKDFSQEKQQEEALILLEKIVLRYRDSSSIWAWQAENEPFFPFGECPWQDESFVRKEVALIKLLDKKSRPVLISDSGEWSFWFRAAKLGDIVGTTLYRKVWSAPAKRYMTYFFPANSYYWKAKLIEKVFHKKVICVELQAEPWGRVLLYDLPLVEQEKTMNPLRFKKIVNFAKRTGFDEFYLWGSEWFFWLKEKQNDPRMWEEARQLFGK